MRFGVGPMIFAAVAVLAGCGSTANAPYRLRTGSPSLTPQPTRHLTARQLRARPGAVTAGTVVGGSDLFGNRVFANARVGFALANDGSAQYPAISTDGGRTWRIDGPQVHIDAADGAEGVGYVGAAGPRMFFAYGSSAVDVTTDDGRTWWEAFLGEQVRATVPGSLPGELVAYVQQSVYNDRINPAVTWQYFSSDGGRHWNYTTAFGG